MIEFLIGLLVLALFGVLSFLGILLFPLFIVMGLFLKLVVGIFILIFGVWLIGKITLFSIEALRKPKNNPSDKSTT